ncbi:hypothetical protein DFP90_1141 [Aestuariispira insulae]|uniref:Uncharacterized protein n=1 Tax=Aestuariispira insulae TaxID=1461337 RepID=A0A3D9H5B9_9PROT|nr:hypothetical protein DFP90_1141 [Aestuariispira insulae]
MMFPEFEDEKFVIRFVDTTDQHPRMMIVTEA